MASRVELLREVLPKAWGTYLGDGQQGEVSPYAAAARAEDVSGLPPAYITVGQADLFRDEDIEYARRLMVAGVPTELAVYPGVPHGGVRSRTPYSSNPRKSSRRSCRCASSRTTTTSFSPHAAVS